MPEGRLAIKVAIPGRAPLEIAHLVFDYNGTLALDGQPLPEVTALLPELAARFAVHLATADTFGTAGAVAQALGVPCHVVARGEDKARLVRGLTGGVAAIGNGLNDLPMLAAADLAVVVLGPEGTAAQAIAAAHLVVPTIGHALALFLHPTRLVATLRP